MIPIIPNRLAWLRSRRSFILLLRHHFFGRRGCAKGSELWIGRLQRVKMVMAKSAATERSGKLLSMAAATEKPQ